MSDRGWIVVRNWERFQHYKDRELYFIKDYIAEQHDPEYRALSGFLRGVLQGVRREYAASNGRLPCDTYELSRRLSLRIHIRHIEALETAGKIQISSSRPAPLRVSPTRAHARSQEKKESPSDSPKERASGGSPKPPPPSTPDKETRRVLCPLCALAFKSHSKLEEHLYLQHDGPEPQHWLNAETRAVDA
jgi:hypothetical protein